MKVDVIGLEPNVIDEKSLYEDVIQYIGVPDDNISHLLIDHLVEKCHTGSKDWTETKKFFNPICDRIRMAHRNLTDIAKYTS